MDIKTARRKYWSQRSGAKTRGIGWELTFQQWLDWWGEDLDRRGQGVDGLQMQRVADQGPYALGNIRKGHPRDNSHTYSVVLQNRKSVEASRAHQAALDAIEPEPADDPADPEDELISSYMSRDPDRPSNFGSKWDRIHRGR